MKKKIFGIIAHVLAIVLALTLTGCFSSKTTADLTPYAEDATQSAQDDFYAQNTGDFGELYSDTQFLSENSFSQVTFSVYYGGGSEYVELMSDGILFSQMYDNGVYPDAIAGDGTYTCYLGVESTDPKTVYFYAQAGGSMSNETSITILGLPDQSTARDVTNTINEISLFADETVSEDEQMAAAMDKIEEMYQNGEAVSYIANDSSIEFTHYSGAKFCYMPEIPGVLSLGDGSAATVLTMEPFDTEFSSVLFSDGYNNMSASGYIDDVASAISQTFSNYYFDSSLDFDEKEVTPALFESLSPNSLLLWFGHGGFSSSEGSFLVTGEQYNEERFEHDREYHNRIVNGEYIITTDGEICITPKFIHKNVGDISGSMIFLNACKSAYSDKLANAFTNRGAESVIAYTDNVYVYWAASMQHCIMTHMTKINPATGNYYSLKEAYEVAVSMYGASDKTTFDKPTKNEAFLAIYGKDYSTVRLADAGTDIPEQTPEQTPSELPQENNNAEANMLAHSAYKDLLLNYSWIPFCPSDLSEIPPEQYSEYWLGTYYCCDINKDGIDELVIKAGQSIADMSMTFFTFVDDGVMHLGSFFMGDSFLYNLTDEAGCIITEHHGGIGIDTYIDMTDNHLSIYNSYEYNYEQEGYVDEKQSIAYAVSPYNVNDISGL